MTYWAEYRVLDEARRHYELINTYCHRTKIELEAVWNGIRQETDTQFTYLDKKFRHKVPRCPQCGQVFISEELAKGKMAQLEKTLEEK